MRGKDGDAPFDGGKDRPPRIAGEIQAPDRGEKKGTWIEAVILSCGWISDMFSLVRFLLAIHLILVADGRASCRERV